MIISLPFLCFHENFSSANMSNYCILSKYYDFSSETCNNAFIRMLISVKVKLLTPSGLCSAFSILRKFLEALSDRKGFFTKAYIL